MKTFIVQATKDRTMMIPLDVVGGHIAVGFTLEAKAPTISSEHFESLRKSQHEYLAMQVDEEKKRFSISQFEIDSIVSEESGSTVSLHSTFDYGWRELRGEPKQEVANEYSVRARMRSIRDGEEA